MKVKLGNLRGIIEGLQVLAAKELPIKHAYWIGKTIPILMKEFQDAESNRYKLCIKHCKKDKDGIPVTRIDSQGKVYDMIDPEEFQAELNELWNLEIDVKFTPISIEQLDGVRVDAATLLKLDGLVVTESEEKE